MVTGRITVTSVPVLICPEDLITGGHTIIVTNLSSDTSVFLDGSSAVPSNAYELRSGRSIEVQLAPSEHIYAVCRDGRTATITYMTSDR